MPEVPPVSGNAGVTAGHKARTTAADASATTLSELVAEVFAADGALARALPDFEPRAGQAEMSAAIARAFERGGVLLAEAGTGTGKTLAYLVPAVLSRERVLVSTGTKNLQEQIFFKDIPALRDALGVPFTATYMKGRANYLCLHRLDQLTGEGRSSAGVTPERHGATFRSFDRLRVVPPFDELRASRASRGTSPVDRSTGLTVDPELAEWVEGRQAQGRPELGRRTKASSSGGRAPRALSDDVFLPIIREWAGRTETGDRAELEDLPEDLPFWNDVSATAETCLGTECLRYDACFVTRMRQRAAASDVVIVNHHLLCADAAVRQSAYGEVIPACSHAILDEAHQLEDVATQYFGFSVSNYRLEELACDAERLASAGVVDDQKARDDIAKAVERLRDYARAFFAELAYAHRAETPGGGQHLNPARGTGEQRGSVAGRGEERVRATDASLAHTKEAAAHLTGALDIVESTLALLRKPGTSADAAAAADRGTAVPGATNDQVAALFRRAGELRNEIRFLLRASNPAYVYFVEFRGRGIFLRASPIDVSAIVREILLDRMRTTVLTSATLTVDGTFDYIRDRLGIAEADQVRFVSEFDFARQAILYLPPRMPDPRSPAFAMAAGRQVVEILKRTRGRAFVLFTSYSALRAVQAIAEMALDYPILVQGTVPRTQLLRQFRETPHSVLFATSSFWQGVDVVGEALSCVVVDKLPFASPGDPITSARIDAIRARGGEPFGEYQVPLAILTLQQGLGRLIRHRRDRGVLAVLDPRLRTKGYGHRFIASLPPAPVVQDLEAVERFFTIV